MMSRGAWLDFFGDMGGICCILFSWVLLFLCWLFMMVFVFFHIAGNSIRMKFREMTL